MENDLIPLSYFQNENVVEIARNLLSCRIRTYFNNVLTEGIICETEAYAGEKDKASHAFGGKRTERTEIMYLSGGHSYVYLCYGIHHLFNIVTAPENVPHAVLIRGIIPLRGKEIMESRRNKSLKSKNFSSGPGKAAQALGINTKHSGLILNGPEISIREPLEKPKNIGISTRIGVEYAKEDALLPYRFILYT